MPAMIELSEQIEVDMTTHGLQLPCYSWLAAEPAEALPRIRTSAEAVEQVQAYVAAGRDEVIFNLPQITSVDAITAAGDVLAEACAS